MEHEHAARLRRHRRHIPRSFMRRCAGWGLIGLGLLGIVLPVLPGLIFIALGILMLGPHDPALRRIALCLRIVLRRWSQMRQPHIRRMGIVARRWHRSTRLALRDQLHEHEHGAHGWKSHVRLLVLVLVGMSVSAGLMLFVWHSIL